MTIRLLLNEKGGNVMYNSTICTQYLQQKMEEEWKRTIQKSKGKKKDKRTHKAESEHRQTEWVLCSDDWRDIVIMYVPQLNNISIEDNYAEISQEEIKKVYKQYKRRAQMKRAT